MLCFFHGVVLLIHQYSISQMQVLADVTGIVICTLGSCNTVLNSPESHNGGHKLEKIAQAIAKPLILKVKCGFSTGDSLYIKMTYLEINTTVKVFNPELTPLVSYKSK